jgi:hypothetical protein
VSEPIYKIWMSKPTAAFYALSDQEREDFLARSEEALEMAGGKMIIKCFSGWSTEQWGFFGVEEFPDVEAVQKHTELLVELDHYRYIESFSMLGTQYPP